MRAIHQRTLVICMIETRAGLENVEAIAKEWEQETNLKLRFVPSGAAEMPSLSARARMSLNSSWSLTVMAVPPL